MNITILFGRVGRDPEKQNFSSGHSKVRFSLATERRYMKDGTAQKITTWHDIHAWGRLGDICMKHVKKGNRVAITGRIEKDKYDDKKTGETKYISYITANELEIIDWSDKTEADNDADSEPATTRKTAPAHASENLDDELPPF